MEQAGRLNFSIRSLGRRLWTLFFVHWRGIIAILAPFAFSPLLLSSLPRYHCVYLIAVMAVLWGTDVIPGPVTSMLPIFAFPSMGIMSTEFVCELYFRQTLVMFTSCITTAIQYSGIHQRMGYRLLKAMQYSPRRLHFAICGFTMFLSMWMSNSTCTLMMVSSLDTILEELSERGLCKMYHDSDEHLPKAERRPSKMKICFYLSVSYAASIGGCGTLIGSPTNTVVKMIYKDAFPKSTSKISFATYMFYAMPFVVLSTFFMFIDMQVVFMGMFRPKSEEAMAANIGQTEIERGHKVLSDKYDSLGPITVHEISVIVLFVILIALHVFKSPPFMKGWSDLLAAKHMHNSVPMVAILILMFVLPDNYKFLKFWSAASLEETPAILSWQYVADKAPWGLIFVIGGGIALAKGSMKTGMSVVLVRGLTFLEWLPHSLTLLILITMLVLLTNLTTNVSVANITMTVISDMAPSMGVHPLYVILPCGMACSMAFMLPVGTPSNVLVQSYANIETKEMIIAGALPTLTTIITIWLLAQTWALAARPELSSFPTWANYIIDVEDEYTDR